jgi:hypothetical protein
MKSSAQARLPLSEKRPAAHYYPAAACLESSKVRIQATAQRFELCLALGVCSSLCERRALIQIIAAIKRRDGG